MASARACVAISRSRARGCARIQSARNEGDNSLCCTSAATPAAEISATVLAPARQMSRSALQYASAISSIKGIKSILAFSASGEKPAAAYARARRTNAERRIDERQKATHRAAAMPVRAEQSHSTQPPPDSRRRPESAAARCAAQCGRVAAANAQKRCALDCPSTARAAAHLEKQRARGARFWQVNDSPVQQSHSVHE